MFRVLPPASPRPRLSFAIACCMYPHLYTLTLSSSLSFLASSRRSSPFGSPGLNDLNDGTSCVSADAHVRAGWNGLARSQCAKPEARGGPARARGAGMGAGGVLANEGGRRP
jgi:hypothetical protein